MPSRALTSWTAITLLPVLIFFGTEVSFTVGEFSKTPENQTAIFGDFVNFTCCATSCDVILQLLVNGKQAAPNDRLSDLNLDPREYEANITCVNGEYMALFWFVANNRTLHTIEHVTCRLNAVTSNRAYITEVINNEYLPSSCVRTKDIPLIHQVNSTDPPCQFTSNNVDSTRQQITHSLCINITVTLLTLLVTCFTFI